MAKSNFSALIDAKKQQEKTENEQNNQQSERNARKNDEVYQRSEAKNTNSEKDKSETLRRTYRIYATHDKAIKVMSKFMGKGTEEEIVLDIFEYYFTNHETGRKALESVQLLENK